ncbi:helix-turn-helix domain-containing protein [Streptacidiphilus cavernicola]|uniref:Helix-turn-helix domain-containing protein n=1 Tax=Streptacidiphilus cavernicola TaxID=3342716 RepID=A0ABV6VQU0_9ACTN
MPEERQAADSAGIGRRIRERRLAQGLLQQDLATAEISTSYVSLIEGGKRRPSDAVLSTLAEKVGSTVEYLRTGRDETEQSNLRLELGFAEMALRNGSPEESLQSFNQILGKASSLAPELVLRARIGQAGALEGLGRMEAAVSILHELAADGSLAAGSAQWANVNVALCRCYRLAGDLGMSVDLGEAAMRRLDELGLDVTEDHIMLGVNLVGAYHLRGDYTRGELLSNRLLARAEESMSRTARGMVYWNASLIAESRGKRDEAVALVERALGLMAEGDNLRLLARLKGLTGGMQLRLEGGDLGRARILLEQAKESLDDVGTKDERGDVELALAFVALRTGRPRDAEELAASAVALLSSRLGDLSAEAQVALGEARILNGRTAEGEESLHAAFRQFQQLPNSRTAAKACRYLGNVWNRLGNTELAMRAYQLGLDLSGAEAIPAPPLRTAVEVE